MTEKADIESCFSLVRKLHFMEEITEYNIYASMRHSRMRFGNCSFIQLGLLKISLLRSRDPKQNIARRTSD